MQARIRRKSASAMMSKCSQRASLVYFLSTMNQGYEDPERPRLEESVAD